MNGGKIIKPVSLDKDVRAGVFSFFHVQFRISNHVQFPLAIILFLLLNL